MLLLVFAGMAKRRKPNRNSDHGKRLLKRLAATSLNSAAGLGEPPEEIEVMNFDVTWDTLPDAVVDALPEATRDRMEQIYDSLQQEPKTVIQELREMIALHPNVPCLTNWLINVLRDGTAAQRREAMALCADLFQRMPGYFFARTTLADLWLERGEVNKAAGLLFGRDLVLTRLYPDRKVFHISEIRHWCYLCARTKIFLGEPDAAEGYRDMLEQLEPDSPAVHHLNELLEGEGSTFTRLLGDFTKLASGGGKAPL